MELTKLAIKRIPGGPLGSLLMHMAGINPATKYTENTVRQHKRVLKSHGYDISKPVKQETENG